MSVLTLGNIEHSIEDVLSCISDKHYDEACNLLEEMLEDIRVWGVEIDVDAPIDVNISGTIVIKPGCHETYDDIDATLEANS